MVDAPPPPHHRRRFHFSSVGGGSCKNGGQLTITTTPFPFVLLRAVGGFLTIAVVLSSCSTINAASSLSELEFGSGHGIEKRQAIAGAQGQNQVQAQTLNITINNGRYNCVLDKSGGGPKRTKRHEKEQKSGDVHGIRKRQSPPAAGKGGEVVGQQGQKQSQQQVINVVLAGDTWGCSWDKSQTAKAPSPSVGCVHDDFYDNIFRA